ncbi:MAG: ATP-binding protein [Marinilabiliaceae bacterium]|nr:ATP-binding protein [Marinilabiliaceae bacterium]
MPETQNIEYKQSWHDDYLKWICGFANAQGGRIYIGKDDSGNVVGVKDYKLLMDELPNKIRNNMGITTELTDSYKVFKNSGVGAGSIYELATSINWLIIGS